MIKLHERINSSEDIIMYTDNIRLERWLYFAVLQFLPVDIAVEQVIFNVTFLAMCHAASQSGIWCLCQQLYTAQTQSSSYIIH